MRAERNLIKTPDYRLAVIDLAKTLQKAYQAKALSKDENDACFSIVASSSEE